MRSGVFSTLKEHARALQPQVHEREIDIVVAARPGLQRIARALLSFQARAHLRQFRARTAALPVAPPVHLLQLVAEISWRAPGCRPRRATSCR